MSASDLPRMTLHCLDQSRSFRILWLLEELDQTIELVAHRRHPKTFRAPKALRSVHPLGKAPLLEVDGEAWAESATIINLLLDRFDDGALRPTAGTPERTAYDYWLNYCESSLMLPVVVRVILDKVVEMTPTPGKPVAGVVRLTMRQWADPELKLHARYLDAHLQKTGYLVGDRFSAADIQLHFALAGALEAGYLDDAYPAIGDYVRRLEARPAWQRAQAVERRLYPAPEKKAGARWATTVRQWARRAAGA